MNTEPTAAAIHCIGEVARAQTLTIRELLVDGWRLTYYARFYVVTVERGDGQVSEWGFNVNSEFYEVDHASKQWKEFVRMLDSGELRADRYGAIMLVE